MNNLSNRLVIYLVGAAAIFVILFGIRGLGFDSQSNLSGGGYHNHRIAHPRLADPAQRAGLAGAGTDDPGGGHAAGSGYPDRIFLGYQAVG